MKKISVLIPTYNEEENVKPLSEAIIEEFKLNPTQYDYEIIFIDNCSQDNTRTVLRDMCEKNIKIKAILNTKNFGQFNSPFYGLMQTKGDCTILMCADFQDPVHMISEFIKEWENGNKIVIGIKTSSKENKLIRIFRSLYYKSIKKMSDVDQIEHFTGFGLYDKSFIEVLNDLNDPAPFLRGIVAEVGFKRKEIPYRQEKRRSGKSSNNFYKLYDAAMLSFTSYTKVGLRIASFMGFIFSGIALAIALVYLVLKIIYWDRFIAGTAPILIGILLFGSIQLFFIGLLGEYIMNINNRVIHRPLVIEEERINFEK